MRSVLRTRSDHASFCQSGREHDDRFVARYFVKPGDKLK